MEDYREYLLVLAQLRLKSWLHDRIDPSDVVQQALLKAHQHRDQFRGQNQAQWRAYLRSILANTVADAISDLPEEKAIQNALDQSRPRLEGRLAAEQSSPSQKVLREEMLLHLAEALARLSDDERAALELRYFQEPPWSLTDIARHLNRPSAKAVAGLLARGLAKLRELLRDDSEK